ncbi:SOH1-domain-containing protein [Pelagophyceae sp. CCMP2097]|nr:SOH1-domain-containing protein [Pelagophyceae sp. CCMP2097]
MRAFGGLSSGSESCSDDEAPVPKRVRAEAPAAAAGPAPPTEAKPAEVPAPAAAAAPDESEAPPDDEQRLRIELDFIQCLASPLYLHYLAQNDLLEDRAFLDYLDYLRYWKRPEYSRFIEYPHCLAFLDMLIDSEPFRKNLKYAEFRDHVHRSQFEHWHTRHTTINQIPAPPELPPLEMPPDELIRWRPPWNMAA